MDIKQQAIKEYLPDGMPYRAKANTLHRLPY